MLLAPQTGREGAHPQVAPMPLTQGITRVVFTLKV